MALRLSTGLRNKLLGLSGNDLISNGDFTSATTGWTAGNSTLSSIAGGHSGNCLQIAETDGVNPGTAYQDITTTVGRLYHISLYFKAGTAAAGKFYVGTTASPASLYTSAALSDVAWTQHQAWFMATETTTRITLESTDATVGETSLFDVVSVGEVLDGFKAVFKDCFINVYTGVRPTSPDDAASGTLLFTIYSNGTSAGLEFDDATAGTISKAAGETWSGTAVATGTAGYFRMFEAGDTPGNASTTVARIDGTVAISGADINMSNTSIVSGAVQTLSSFVFTMPAA